MQKNALPFKDCLHQPDFAGDEVFLFFEGESSSEVEVVDFEGYMPAVSAVGEIFEDFACRGALGYGEMDATGAGAAGVDVDDFVEIEVYVSDCVRGRICACQRMGDVEGEVEGVVFRAAVVGGAVSAVAAFAVGLYVELILHFEVFERDVVGFCFADVVAAVAADAAVEEVFHPLGGREECVDCGLHVLDCDFYSRGLSCRCPKFLSGGIDAVEEAAEVEVVVVSRAPFGCPSSRVEGQNFGAEVVCRDERPHCPECGYAGDVGVDRAGVEVENGGVDGYGRKLRESAEDLFEVSVGGGVGV